MLTLVRIVLGSLMTALVLLLVVLIAGSRIDTEHVPGRSEACLMSEKFVKDNLKAPATAQFPSSACNATQDGNTWKVRSYVDAQNGFGAMIRSDYGVEMRYNSSSETWTLLDIAIVP